MEGHRTPFPAIVGQEELKRALLAVAVDDGLDGLLVRGEKGTAKSTAVRGLVDLLPDQRVVADCPYGCPPGDPTSQCETCRSRDLDDAAIGTRPVPLVTLPLGATRERVVGTLSVADALDGSAEFDPGLLARANRGVLYVDEVNLLDDHLVDVVLDAAASGVNRVERDGVSVSHPANFTLVGTMNPEEGDLRPQLRDRFALQARVTGCRDPDDRVAIIDRALDRTADPASFADAHETDTDARREQLLEARERLGDVVLPEEFKREIAELCLEAGVEGHRGDIAIARAARALAALDGRRTVIEPDVEEAAGLALPHRLRSRPFEDGPDPDEVLEDHFGDERDGSSADGEEASDERENGGSGSDERGDEGGTPDEREDEGSGSDEREDDDPADDAENDARCDDVDPGNDGEESDGGDGEGSAESSGAPSEGPTTEPSSDAPDEGNADADDSTGDGDERSQATPLVPGQRRAAVGDADRPPVDEMEAGETTQGNGSRVRADASEGGHGPRVRTERTSADEGIDPAASIRAAAGEGRTRVEEDDLRTPVRRSRTGALIVFVVDASASMRPAMADAKGTVVSLLEDAYEHRDEVAFVAVAGEEADVVLPPTTSVTLAARHLKQLPTGDRTPLPSGLDEAARLVARTDADASLVVVVTDGRANVADGSPTETTRNAARRLADADAELVVVDASDDDRTGLIGVLEGTAGARRVPLSDLSAERIARAAATVASARES